MAKNDAWQRPAPLVLKWEEVLEVVPLEEDEIRRQIEAGTFPRPRQLSQKIIGWLTSDVQQWFAELEVKQAPPEISNLETELYRHFDAEDRLLYVGVSLSTALRYAQHRTSSHWAKQVTRITIERFPTRAAALEAERQAIQSEHPLHNRSGRVRSAESPLTTYVEASDPSPPGERLKEYFRSRGFKV